MRRLRLSKIFRPALVIALSLWVAGAGCLLGCEGMIAKAFPLSNDSRSQASDLATVVSADACASKSHDCCAKRNAKAEPISTETADGLNLQSSLPASTGMEGCPLAMSRSAATSASARGRDMQIVAVNHEPLAAPIDNSDLPRSFSAQLRSPNRGHTYLHCCAFLI